VIRSEAGDLSALVASAGQWRDADAGLAVIGLPTHAKPESLSALAEAVATLA
jgi:hypothetical protein